MNKALTALTVTLTSFALLLTAAPASADETSLPPVITGDGTTDSEVGNGTDTGGGTSVTTPAPEGTNWVHGSISLPHAGDWHWNFHFNYGASTAHVNGSCPPRMVNGDADWQPTGATWQYLIDEETAEFAGGYDYWCSYPPEPQDTPVTCVSRLELSVVNREGPSAVRSWNNGWAGGGGAREVHTSAWASDRDNAAKCASSGLSGSIAAPMDDLGAYLLAVEGTVHDCTRRDYPGTNRAPRIVRCGNAHTTAKQLRGGVWCNGSGWDYAFGADSWNHEWTWARCASQVSDLIDCNTEDQPITYAGHDARNVRDPADTMDDGKERVLQFRPFNPRGVLSISNVQSRLQVARGSTPMRGDTSVNSARQPFMTPNGFGTWIDGDQTRWPIAFYAASTPDSPFEVNRRMLFDARVRVQVTTIQRINFDGQPLEVETTTSSRVVTARDVGCQSGDAFIEAYRARLANH